jgi:hypothetical protein
MIEKDFYNQLLDWEDQIKNLGLMSVRDQHEMDMPFGNYYPGFDCRIYYKNGLIYLEEQDIIKEIVIGLGGGYEKWICRYNRLTRTLLNTEINFERSSKNIPFQDFIDKLSSEFRFIDEEKGNLLRRKFDSMFSSFIKRFFPIAVIERYEKPYPFYNKEKESQLRLDSFKNMKRDYFISVLNDDIKSIKQKRPKRFLLDFLSGASYLLVFNSIDDLKLFLEDNVNLKILKDFLKLKFDLSCNIIHDSLNLYLQID